MKSYLGIAVEETDEIKEIIVNNIETDTTLGEAPSENPYETSQIDIERKNLKLYNVDLNQLIISDASPYDIVAKINDIKETNNRIKELGYVIETSDINTDYNDNNEFTIYDSTKDIDSRWYDIGDIGSNLRFCVSDFSILKPYGYLIEYTNSNKTKYNIIGSKNTSLWIKTQTNNDVTSLFNGKIYSLERDEQCTGAKNICINHGNGVYTIFKHINIESDISKGDIISQYQKLGTVAGASDAEGNTYIELQLIIDNEYINPILLFDKSGEYMYNNYKKYSEEEYVVESDEYYYYTEDISIINPNRQ